jgi:hypothetical protein
VKTGIVCYVLLQDKYMNHTTISDANELSKGSPINSLHVHVKKSFEYNEGEGKGGTYRYQSVVLQDDTGEIMSKFWNHWNTDFRNLEGEDIIITSGTDKKGKFSGIITDEYKGTKQLKISENATLHQGEGSQTEQASETSPADAKPDDDFLSRRSGETHGRRIVDDETKRESIERQVALKAATDLASNGVIQATAESVTGLAGEFYKFLHGS